MIVRLEFVTKDLSRILSASFDTIVQPEHTSK